MSLMIKIVMDDDPVDAGKNTWTVNYANGCYFSSATSPKLILILKLILP
jgi:hypothetical protein